MKKRTIIAAGTTSGTASGIASAATLGSASGSASGTALANASASARPLVALGLGVLLCACGDGAPGAGAPSGALPGALVFEGRFSGTQATPPTSSGAGGSVQVTLDASRTTLRYTVRHSVAAAQGAGLFRGPSGQEGALIADLDAATEVRGELPVGPGEVAELLGGRCYVTVRSAAFQRGEVRAQLLGLGAAAQVDETVSLSATLGPDAAADPQRPPGRGAATLTLDVRSGALSYEVQHDLGAGASLQLRSGALGEDGAALLSLPGASGKVTLDAEAQLLLRSGLLYVQAQGDGRALRGQIVSGRTLPFTVALAPAPLVLTAARGRAHFVLSPGRDALAFRLQHDAAQVTGASISRGLLGLGGRALCTLKDGADGAQGLCEIKAQGAADVLLLGDLIGGELRVNVTTRAHLLGELQGLLVPPL